MLAKRFFPLATALGLTSLSHAAPLLITGFETETFENWDVSGTAFGKGPVTGQVGGQQEIAPAVGERFANSFHGGDKATGTLTSPEFEISQNFITFYIGGGAYSGRTCMNLLVDGEIVRTAVGPNSDAGGTEKLIPQAWDVSEFAGKQATLQIVDTATGGWGHVTVDEIVLTNDKGEVPIAELPPQVYERTLTIEQDFLNFPLLDRDYRQGPGVSKFSIFDKDGETLRFMRLRFPEPGQEPDFVYSVDVSEFKGQEVTLSYTSSNPKVLELIEPGDEFIADENAYKGPHRPKFHFSPRRGWMNDVNGTYYHNGKWHLFYQHNPVMTGTTTGFDMHWGHSVSEDLVHWEEYPVALFPDKAGNIFSGTACMIRHEIPGLSEGKELPTPALFFTGTSPFSQHIATTDDDGRTWQRYEGNPVIDKIPGRKGDRDPKVIWHEESGHYVMFLYVGGPAQYFVYCSKNLIDWEETQRLDNWHECPEFFAYTSPTTGKKQYLLYGNYRTDSLEKDDPNYINIGSAYQLGNFDGKTFTPIGEPRQAHNGGNFYAALTFMNEPEGRRLMMGWAAGTRFPDEPFNQCATVPLRMQLKDKGGVDTLCYEPAKEVDALRGEAIYSAENITGKEANEYLATLPKDALLDTVVTFAAEGQPGWIDAQVRDKKFGWDTKSNAMSRGNVTLHPDGPVETRFLIDHGIIESFWNGGEAAYSQGSLVREDLPVMTITDGAKIDSIVVYPMSNIWE